MPVVFRSALSRLTRPPRWVFMLGVCVLLLIAVDRVPDPAFLAVAVAIVFGGSLAVAMTVALMQTAGRALFERERHRYTLHRFLCPSCLCFGPRAFGCSACGREIGHLEVITRGSMVDCPHCGAPLGAPPGASPARRNPQIRGLCRRCRRMCRVDIFHERNVRAIGVPSGADVEAFCAATPGLGWRRTDKYARADDGTALTYVIDLATLAGTLPSDHAARAIEGVWLHGYAVESLIVGGILDRYIHDARLPQRHQERMEVAVAATALPDATGDMLAARFRRVRCGVSASAAFSGEGFGDAPGGDRQTAEPGALVERPSRMRVLAALTPAGFETLQAAFDPETCAELERGWVYGEIAGGSRYLTHLSNWRVRQDGFRARPALREIEAVWLDPSGMTPLALGEALDQVDRKMSDSRIWREEVRLCIAAGEPGSAIRNVLESRYSRISYGVRPEAFLAFGASFPYESSRRA